jgi:hypothetical protein
MTTMPIYPDPSNHLRTILRRVNIGTLPTEAAAFATAALVQIVHLHLVIEDLQSSGMMTNGPEELLNEIATVTLYWLQQ